LLVQWRTVNTEPYWADDDVVDADAASACFWFLRLSRRNAAPSNPNSTTAPRAERPAINATFGGESDGNVDEDDVSGTGTTAPDGVVGSADWVPTTVVGDVSSAEGTGERGSVDVDVSVANVADDRGSVDVVVVAATKLGASINVRLLMQNKHPY
jgi:hypothetical protein